MEEGKGRTKRQLPVIPKKSERKTRSASSLAKEADQLRKHVSSSVIEAGERLAISPPGSKPRVFMGYDDSNVSTDGEDSSVIVAVRVRPFSDR